MNQLSISLAKLNGEGLVASVEDREFNSLDIYSEYVTDDVEFVCRHAAKRLRVLADAFDCLATMSKPCTEQSHVAAYAAAKQAASSIEAENTSMGGESDG